MKNLNKKTGIIALAGMLIAGGVAVSGVSAYADSSFTPSQNKDIERVNCFCKRSDAIFLGVTKNEQEIKDCFKKCDHSIIYNNGHAVEVKNAADIASHIRQAERYKKEVMEVKLHGLCYLIEIN